MPIKSHQLRLLAVSAGLLILFTGIWNLVRQSSRQKAQQNNLSRTAQIVRQTPAIKEPEKHVEPQKELLPTVPVEIPTAPLSTVPIVQMKEPVLTTPESPPAAVQQPVEFVGPIQWVGPIQYALPTQPELMGPPKPPAMIAGQEELKPAEVVPPAMKDVTGSYSSSHDMEGEPEDGPVEAAPGAKTTGLNSRTSANMPGWELIHFNNRDYVTADSIQKFYRFKRVIVKGRSVRFDSNVLVMRGNIGSAELLINNIKFVLSYPILLLNNKPCISRLDLSKLIDPVLRPSYIGSSKPFNTVVIDAGHGGNDSGARGIYGNEKDFALSLALELRAVLQRRGVNVVMTRSTDVFLSLGKRVEIANKIPNSIFISIHFNAGRSAAHGIETFALTPQGSSSIYGARAVDGIKYRGNQLDSENIALATAIHAGVIHRFKSVDRGVKRGRWQVLKGLNKPGVLFEGGFVTNQNDARLIASQRYRKEMAEVMAQSILNYRTALSSKRR